MLLILVLFLPFSGGNLIFPFDLPAVAVQGLVSGGRPRHHSCAQACTWRGVSFQRTRSHTGQELRTGANVGWGGSEYRPAQNPEARSLPCLSANPYFSRLSPFPSLGSLCGFGSKDLPCRKTQSICLLYPNRLNILFKKRPEKIKWYIKKSRTSIHRAALPVRLERAEAFCEQKEKLRARTSQEWQFPVFSGKSPHLSLAP